MPILLVLLLGQSLAASGATGECGGCVTSPGLGLAFVVCGNATDAATSDRPAGASCLSQVGHHTAWLIALARAAAVGATLLFGLLGAARPLCTGYSRHPHRGRRRIREHSAQFHKWATEIVDAAKKLGIADANITYLGEKPTSIRRGCGALHP
jgi:hypothetical protein